MNDDPPPDRAPRPRRKWLMRLLAVAVSLVPFLLLEISLRLFASPVAGAVDFDPLVDLHQLRPLFELNDETGRWEIPPTRYNFFRPDSFLANKPAGSRRIFVLGGSTVQGRPYAIETSFATWLRLRLEAASPDVSFEVVNCGGVSYASYRVARVLDEVLGHQPDAIVVYTGHNEFLEDREYAEIREMSAPVQIMARIAGNIRTVTWLQGKFSGSTVPQSVMSGEVNARLDHSGGLDRYKRDASWRQGVEQHFAKSIQRMISSAKKANVPIVVCVPAGELVKTPPFKVETGELEPSELEKFNTHWAIAQSDLATTDERIAATRDCLAIDPEHAGAHYVNGRLRYEQSDAEAAREHLIAARDFDVCPLRATTPIVQAAVAIAQRNRVPWVDTTGLLDQRDSTGKRRPDGIVDPEFYVDHVHPTVAAHQVIGAEIASEIEKLGWFQRSADAESRYEQLAKDHLGTLGEEYYARGRQRLEGLRQWAAGRAGKFVPTSDAQ